MPPPSSIFRPLSAPVLAGLGSDTASDSSANPTGSARPVTRSQRSAAALGPGSSSSSFDVGVRSDSGAFADSGSSRAASGNVSNPGSAEAMKLQSGEADLGEDAEFDPAGISIADLKKGATLRALAADAIAAKGNLEADHRNDGIYDELDDLDGVVAESNPHASAPNISVRRPRGLDRIAVGRFAANHIRAENRVRQNRRKDKSNYATTEGVLDEKTRMELFKLINHGHLRSLEGCVSTGKEANVYHAIAAGSEPGVLTGGVFKPDVPAAVKVYRTSILSFRDRERYVTGEFRFNKVGYKNKSNRSMVMQWAEKEFRNLHRLQQANIPCPVPLLSVPPILVMTFFGRDGFPAPLLKNANMSGSRAQKTYFRVCVLMRRMFHGARLVHGDLSEYNMIYWNSEVIIIDVSQSVEHDHPMALDFLRRDCSNVNAFFQKCGVPNVLKLRELFDYIVALSDDISEEKCAKQLRALMDKLSSAKNTSNVDSVQEDKVFMKSYIPRSLNDVTTDIAKEVDRVVEQGPDSVLYGKLTGLTITQKTEPDEANNLAFPNLEVEEDDFDDVQEPIATRLPSKNGTPEAGEVKSSSDGTASDPDAEDDDFEEATSNEEPGSGSCGNSRDLINGVPKKEWKKQVKLEARERRESKTPKHVKKRKEALAKRRRGVKVKK